MAIRIATPVLLCCIIAIQPVAFAQKKADKALLKQLRADITYLSSDELEGRRISTAGERKAAEYIQKAYIAAGLAPYKSAYQHPFKFAYGKEVSPGTRIGINNETLRLEDEAFPLPFSANGKVSSDVLADVMEQGSVWIMPLYMSQDEADDPHFDYEKSIFERGKEAATQGASGVIFFDGFGSKFTPVFNRHSEYTPAAIPCVFLSHKAYQRTIGKGSTISVNLDITINKAERSGINVAAYIDNRAEYTVVLGAHFDHLGYGEDGNSLYANAGKAHLIHHGADDNASGTAALLAMAKRIKGNKRLNHYNYLFVNFSGEELGLYGSKAFVKDEGIDSAHIAYMMNMDMVGRLNDSTHALSIGGVGTSPAWSRATALAGDKFKLVIDSSGTGPSDHTSFYNSGIPVLFFFTGSHKDYHKPSDTAGLINYTGEVLVIKYMSKVIAAMDKENVKPVFTPTRQNTTGIARFKVTLGIMPDYTFESGGVRVDGVSDNRPAMKAGIRQGDIITRLGDNKIMGMQTYMEALGKFAPGDKTQITLLRSGKEIVLAVELAK